MRIINQASPDVKPDINLANEKAKPKTVEVEKKEETKKDKEPKVDVIAINEAKHKGIESLFKGKTTKVLDELNKQKVTTNDLKEAVDKLKDNKTDDNKKDVKKTENEDKKNEIKKDDKPEDKKEIDPKAKKIIDKLDLNKDGKVSPAEVKAAKEKMTLNLVKNLVDGVKKDNDEVQPDKFKNIVKMINDDLIGGKDAIKINKFLDN